MLQTLTEHAVLAFLAVARRRPEETAVAEPAWRSEVVAAVEHRREALAAIWSQARGGDDAALVDGLAEELEGIARAVTARL